MKIAGRGIVLKLNGYTVECLPDASSKGFSIVIEIVGDANTVIGPGTRE